MATYIKTLKEDNGDITYPQTKASAVLLTNNSDLETELTKYVTAEDIASTSALTPPVQTNMIADGAVTAAKLDSNAVTTAKIADDAVTSAKMDWSTLDGSELGWKYLGQTKLTAAGSTVTFIFPERYSNYKVYFAGELASGSNVWNDFRFYNGSTALALDYQVQDITGSTDYYGTSNGVTYAMNGNGSQYDTINMDLYTFKTASTQWRKFQGSVYIIGSVFRTRHHSGRLTSSTEPDRVTVITGGTYGAGAVLKVWGSNN